MTAHHSFAGYQTEGFHDELFDKHGRPRPGAKVLHDFINGLEPGALRERQEAIERALHRMGITFAVYGDQSGTEKIFPFDIVPRIVEAYEWNHIAAGLKQRIGALNQFIDDIYHEQIILKEQIIPQELVTGAESFRKQCVGLSPPQRIWCHITGTDLIRHQDGAIYVLEDNLRSPSGVS